MDDLLDNFANQRLDSPTEEGYKYHFVNGSPAGSQHERPEPLEMPTSAGPSPFFETPSEDEANYNADVEESDDGQGLSDGLSQHLQQFHRQDLERDQLLTQLHQENQELKRISKESVSSQSVPGRDPRAEAAERSLFEIRKTFVKNPYVCVLVDGAGYKIHEDLLQAGKRGGAEAADRLEIEVSDYIQQFGGTKSCEIMVHLYIDIGGLLARCVSNDIPLSDGNVRDFMLGFTQAQPLFHIVDVGYDAEKLLRKVDGMFHLFVNNVQCKHLIFGCCHNSAYAITLERYTSNPITASSITLLKSYEGKTCFEGLPFNSVEFPHIFRSLPFKETDKLAEDHMHDLTPQPGSGRIIGEVESSRTSEVAALRPARARPQAQVHSDWVTENKVLLNINDERVDRELGEVDYETSESMLDRIEQQAFCTYYHVFGSCISTKTCNFRHGPKLSNDELRFLKKYCRRLACQYGSICRRADCLYGHTCADQPVCEKGRKCHLYRFHEVDKTVVKVWLPGKNSSPRGN